MNNDSQTQNKTEHLADPIFHFVAGTSSESENVVNSTIIFSDNYTVITVIDIQSQNISIKNIDDDNLSEIPTNYDYDDDFFSDEEEGNELVEALDNNIDKSETRDHSCSNSY